MPKTALYYFSATGNSLVVARDLADGLAPAELVPINKALINPDATAYDAVGFVYPVYMFGLPLIIAEFLSTVRVNPGAYVFSVATLGGLPGRAHSLAKKILNEREIKLACGFSIVMPGNYTPLYGAFSRDQQQKLFAQQKIKTARVIDYLHHRRQGVMEQGYLISYLFYKLLYSGGAKQIPRAAKGFWITPGCTRCGLCAKICPVSNIELPDGHPVWLDHCQHCMACLQWCPVEAIQYKRMTLGKKRYHHPDITALEIIG
jgi:ferredoxin